jgi:hypothetical protein
MATTPTEIDAFNHEMESEWGLATTQFRIVGGPTNRYNCIASAVEANGVATRKLTPPNMNILDAQYALKGYYPTTALPLQAGDVEVYTKPSATGVPVHAHRVLHVAADANASTCRSKYGDDCLVEHPRTAFTRAKANGTYVYGTLTRRYRYDAARLAKDREAIYVTRSGRQVKRKDLDTTTSGTLLPAADIVSTKTGTKKRKTSSGATTSNTTKAAKTVTSGTATSHTTKTAKTVPVTSGTATSNTTKTAKTVTSGTPTTKAVKKVPGKK